MYLRAGIPLISELEALKQDQLLRDHIEFNRQFLSSHAASMKAYGARWGDDPLRLWSRRWEYPFVASHVLAFAAEQPRQEMTILDAGSGVTYFPHLLCSRIPHAKAICCDSNTAYGPMFDAINANQKQAQVSFRHGVLQSLPLKEGEVDVVCCISVLEHTDNYKQILKELARVLRPGGLLALTFDLSLDGRFKLRREEAADLLAAADESFACSESCDIAGELQRLDQPDQILSTNHVKKTEPEYLPWTHPLLLAIKDLIDGKGWTGGFRSKSVFCLAARRRG